MRYLLAVFIASLAITSAASAFDLSEALAQGKVGEKNDGYVQALVDKDLQMQSFVSQVNSKRQAEYSRVSMQNAQTVQEVAKMAASRNIAALTPGESYQDEQGNWVKK